MPKYCNDVDFKCGANADCRKNECVCAGGYEWVPVAPPFSVEKLLTRQGCKRELT